MKINSRISAVLLAFLAIFMVISAASAVNSTNDFHTGDFGIKIIPGVNLTETVNIGTDNMNLTILENSGNNSNDVNSVIYFKDSTDDKNEITGFIKDLENDANKVEQTDKYVVLKNTQSSHDFDIANDLEGIFNFASGIFSSDGINVSSQGNSIALSGDGLEISDASGENVSVTREGVNVSGASSGNETVNVSSDVNSNIEDCDYSIYVKNQNNDSVIVISGNNLELLKEMAENCSFNEN